LNEGGGEEEETQGEEGAWESHRRRGG
jgi:hypothetical protein